MVSTTCSHRSSRNSVSTPTALATASRVGSSTVGPSPPVVMMISARCIDSRMAEAMRSTLSPMVMVRYKSTPRPRRVSAMWRVLVSTISPSRISVPMVMISADGIFGHELASIRASAESHLREDRFERLADYLEDFNVGLGAVAIARTVDHGAQPLNAMHFVNCITQLLALDVQFVPHHHGCLKHSIEQHVGRIISLQMVRGDEVFTVTRLILLGERLRLGRLRRP